MLDTKYGQPSGIQWPVWRPRDRHPELVFIGHGMDPNRIMKVLNAYLLRDAEMALGAHGWGRFEDPYPPIEEDFD